MTFDEWWKQIKPAECDEVKPYFEEAWQTAVAKAKDDLLKKRAPKPRELPRCGTGGLHDEQQYCCSSCSPPVPQRGNSRGFGARFLSKSSLAFATAVCHASSKYGFTSSHSAGLICFHHSSKVMPCLRIKMRSNPTVKRTVRNKAAHGRLPTRWGARPKERARITGSLLYLLLVVTLGSGGRIVFPSTLPPVSTTPVSFPSAQYPPS